MAVGGAQKLKLLEVDRAEVLCLVDNYADRLEPGNKVAHRLPYCRNGEMLPGPIAEHGFSALIKVFKNGDAHTVLFDTGVTETAAVQNMKTLKVDFSAIEAVVISHGHVDHTGGLLEVLRTMNRNSIPVIMHPDGFRKRWIIFPEGERTKLSTIDENSLVKNGAQVIKNRSPYLICNDMVLASGEIKRQTEFEKGFPLSYAEIDGKLENDFETKDDQALILNVSRKGLVILSGCGHAGIVNTVLYAREITGIENVHAIMGGFHLTGKFFEPFIDRTVGMIRDLKPAYVVPCHCTGWKAIHSFASAFPTEYIHNVVGTTFVFEA